jgi:hypothetical protein
MSLYEMGLIFLKKYYYQLLILLVFILKPAINTNAQAILNPDYIVVSGLVMDIENDSALLFANIYNPRTMRGTISDKNGYFRYYALPGDTLWFSSMGYYPLHYAVIGESGAKIRDTFYLKARVYKIHDVEILALTRYEKLRYDIKNMKIPRDIENARNNFPIVNHNVNAFYERNNENFGLVFSPISALYDAFSKEGRERRKLAELQRQDAIKAQIEPHFNIDMVKRITGLEDQLAQEFIEFCNFSEEFLLNAPDYYIIEIILEQYEDFCVLKGIENKNE